MIIDESISISKWPIEDLYRLITRWDLLLPKIDRSITKLTMMPPQGPVAPGTVFFERMTMLYLPVEITATIGQMRPPTGYDYGATAKGLAGGGTMTLRDLGGGSVEFHVHIELRPTTAMMWIVTHLLGWKFRALERARLAKMQEMLASGELVPPAG